MLTFNINMVKTDIEKLTERLEKLENNFGKKTKEESKESKTPRKPSEYNLFMKKYFAKNKKEGVSHKELFAEAAKAWSNEKK